MPRFIAAPTVIAAAGHKPKRIEEYAGRVNSGHATISVARMVSPQGWMEPGQRPEFEEITVVLSGALHVEHAGGTLVVRSGQAVVAEPGEWIRYSSPEAGGAEYLAVCLPAFSPDTVHRDGEQEATMRDSAESVNRHYGRADLGERILAALRAAGKDLEALTVEDLSPIDHFHIRGREATLELARLADFSATHHVLDVGGGIGGPARTLAAELGCRVTVLDLTEEFCRVGEMLSQRTGFADRVSFRAGSALAMPFEDRSFDAAWTQHSSMNIEDKATLYAEIHRVLRPGARLAIHEIMAGPGADLHFPVPWSSDGTISFLRTPESMRSLIAAAGFHEVAWIDGSSVALGWVRDRLAAAGPPPVLGLHVLIGENTPVAMRNVERNFAEERIRVVEAVFERR